MVRDNDNRLRTSFRHQSLKHDRLPSDDDRRGQQSRGGWEWLNDRVSQWRSSCGAGKVISEYICLSLHLLEYSRIYQVAFLFYLNLSHLLSRISYLVFYLYTAGSRRERPIG